MHFDSDGGGYIYIIELSQSYEREKPSLKTPAWVSISYGRPSGLLCSLGSKLHVFIMLNSAALSHSSLECTNYS
jgi:hypothetical protein